MPHLDDDHQVTLLRDDVEFEVAHPDVLAKDAKAARRQIIGNDFFGQGASSMGQRPPRR